MKHYKHIFFDLDRTLWDFETNSAEAMLELFVRFDLASMGITDFNKFHERYRQFNDAYWIDYRDGKMEKALLRWIRFYKTFEVYGIQNETLAKQFAEAYVSLAPTKEILIEGVGEVLEILHSQYPLHIITNGFEEVQHIKLTSGKIHGYFTTVINSESTGHKKPAKEIYDYACRLTGSEPHECLMIGDDYIADVTGAMDAGWDAIWYNPANLPADREVLQVKKITDILLMINLQNISGS